VDTFWICFLFKRHEVLLHQSNCLYIVQEGEGQMSVSQIVQVSESGVLERKGEGTFRDFDSGSLNK
jgi:hypothetical protein